MELVCAILVLLSQDTFSSPTTAKKNSGEGRKSRKHWVMTEQPRLEEVQLWMYTIQFDKRQEMGKKKLFSASQSF